jgi:hypothetical protein
MVAASEVWWPGAGPAAWSAFAQGQGPAAEEFARGFRAGDELSKALRGTTWRRPKAEQGHATARQRGAGCDPAAPRTIALLAGWSRLCFCPVPC